MQFIKKEKMQLTNIIWRVHPKANEHEKLHFNNKERQVVTRTIYFYTPSEKAESLKTNKIKNCKNTEHKTKELPHNATVTN